MFGEPALSSQDTQHVLLLVLSNKQRFKYFWLNGLEADRDGSNVGPEE